VTFQQAGVRGPFLVEIGEPKFGAGVQPIFSERAGPATVLPGRGQSRAEPLLQILLWLRFTPAEGQFGGLRRVRPS